MGQHFSTSIPISDVLTVKTIATSLFISLWLSCNSWYKFHYSLLDDRKHIDRIKSDFSNSNKLYKEFERLFKSAYSKEQKALFTNIELLHYSLNRKTINAPRLIGSLNFENVLIDYSQKSVPTAYTSVIVKNAKKKNGKLKASANGVDFGDMVFINDSERVFAGLFEIIYQIRCLLVHGDFDPTNDNQEIIKYCYLILVDLMKPFCG